MESHPGGGGVEGIAALRQAARSLQDDLRSSKEILEEVVKVLPHAWRSSETSGVRVFFEELDVRSEGFEPTLRVYSAEFSTPSGDRGGIQVSFLGEPPLPGEDPLLPENQALLDTMAEMLRGYFQRMAVLGELREAQERIRAHRRQLGRLTSELSLSEARQRRAIAQELHDHIGQALAFIRMRVARFQGDSFFCGFEDTIAEILRLLDQAISSTRSLTFEISPPVLYELGLAAALEWLGDRFGADQDLSMDMRVDKALDELPGDTRVLLFHSVRELLVNVLKHAEARNVRITAGRRGDRITVEVVDDGRGFQVETAQARDTDLLHFGLFSIQERLDYLEGSMVLRSNPGQGTHVTLSVPFGGGAPEKGDLSP